MNFVKIPVTNILFHFFFSVGIIFAQTQKDYLNGVKSLNNKDTLKAIEHFEKSIKNNQNAQSHFELAKINYEYNTLNSLLKSRLLIQEAIKQNQSNIKYRYLYADILKKLFRINAFDRDGLSRAKEEYLKIIEINSESSKAYYELGKLVERDFYEYFRSEIVELDYSKKNEDFYKGDFLKEQWNKFINSLFESGSYASLKADRISNLYLDEALEYFDKSIKYDSVNLDAYIRSSLLLIYNKQYKESLEILLPSYDKFKDNYKFNLSMAFNYFKLHDYTKANSFFTEAFNLMSEKERYEYKVLSVLEILEADLKDKLIKLDKSHQEAAVDYYWRIKDPLNITEENERLLEHYARVFYANNFLSDYDQYMHSSKEIKTSGWQTERGIALLRFGEPLNRKKLRSTFDMVPKTDYWDYGDFKLAFNETSNRQRYRLSEFESGQYYSDTKMVYDNLIKTTPERYYPEFEGPLINVIYNTIQFKNLDNKNSDTDFYLNYLLKSADGELHNQKFLYRHIVGVFFSDRRFNKLYEKKDTLSYLNLENSIKIENDEYIVKSIYSHMRSGQENLAFEVIREKDKGLASYHGKMNIKDFSGDSLMLSDIVLANDVNFAKKTKGTIQRKNYNILPNPTSKFDNENMPFIYYEIYNLEKGVNNLTSFKQEIILRKIDESNELGNILNSFLDIIGFDNKGNEITLSSDYSTIERNPDIYLQLDLNNYEASEYLITITITDNVSGKKISRTVKIIWL